MIRGRSTAKMTDKRDKEPPDIVAWRRHRREFSRLGNVESRQAAMEALDAAMARWFGLSYADPSDAHALALARTLRAIRIASDLDQSWLRAIGDKSRDFLLGRAAASGDAGGVGHLAPSDLRLPPDVEIAQLAQLVHASLGEGCTGEAITEKLLIALALPISGIGGALAERGVDALDPEVEVRAKRAVVAAFAAQSSTDDRSTRAADLVGALLDALAPSGWKLPVQRPC